MKAKENDHSKYTLWIDPEDVIPYEKNAKIHTEKQIANIANSIRRYGWQQDTVITTDRVLVIGHGRRLAALQLGCKMPYHVIDKTADELTDEDIRELRIVDNQTNAETGMDWELLEEEISDLDFDGFDFDLTGDGDETPATDDDFEMEPPEEPKSKRGEIYQLGRHRLMCGDSTKAEDVQALVAGREIDLLLTDPPYNVALGHYGSAYDANKLHRRTDGILIANDDMGDEEFVTFLASCLKNAGETMRAGAAFYIWHASSQSYNTIRGLHAAGFEERQTLIWAKQKFTLSRSDYQWKHEPCLYGWKEGAAHYFCDSRTESTVIEDLTEIDPKKMTKPELVELVTKLLELHPAADLLEYDKPNRSEMHPTMKPVALFDYLIRNSTKKGEAVLDLFGGSGTTLVCCEQDGRDAFLMEYEPRFVDVIIERWEQLTGKKAELIQPERGSQK